MKQTLPLLKTAARHLWQRRLLRFLLVGSFNTGFDLVLLNLFVFALGLNPLLGNLYAATITICVSFLLNRHLVFQHKTTASRRQFVIFFAITASGVAVIQSLVIITVSHAFSPSFWAQLLSLNSSWSHVVSLNIAKALAVIAAVAWNYILYARLVFHHHKTVPQLAADEAV